MDDLEAHRKHYSQLVTTIGRVDPTNTRLISAFANVKREDYLGPGPWKIRANSTYIVTPTENPAFLYQDVLVALKSDEGLNNGQPSLHARCLDKLEISAGDTVIHIGTGTGYYTAILAELAGSKGRVCGYEIDKGLAQRATQNLKDKKHVEIHSSSGAQGDLPSSDVIYISAGVTEPESIWLNTLKDGGRLLFPLTSSQGTGGMLLIQRIKEHSYSANFIATAGFIPCVGARDEKTAIELADAFYKGGAREVKSLHRDKSPDDTCWFKWADCWLSTKSV